MFAAGWACWVCWACWACWAPVLGGLAALAPSAAAAEEGASVPDTAGAAEAAGEDTKAQEAELERIRKDLEDKRREAANIAGQEQDLSGEIEKISQELNLNQELLRKLGRKKADLLDELSSAQDGLVRAEMALGAAGGTLGARLRGIYKFGRGQLMEVMLTSKTFADLAERIHYLSVLADHDRELIAEFESTVETRRALVEHIEGKRLRLEQTEFEVVEEAQRLEERKQERDALVERLKDRRYYFEEMARDLQEAGRNLEQLLGQIDTSRDEGGSTTFEGQMGRLVWPCEGEVISDYGVEQHPKFGTIIKNNGMDIKAVAGSQVRAVAGGTVSFAGPLSGFGTCVIVDHGGGYYTFYGRLESVAVATGFDIAQGDQVGSVGETSAPEGPVLHFEIRQGKKALDPRLWLLR
jgi:septal ring factor EnvC (AmiA/AmiB activator)